MAVNKIVISTIPATTISGQLIFDTCPSGPWICSGNQLTWKTPIPGGDVIPPRSAKSFFVSPAAHHNNDQILNGVPVFASVMTDYGQFGKTSYLTSSISPSGNNREAIVNVYHSNVQDSLTDIRGTVTFNAGETKTLFFTLSENSTSSVANNAYLKSGANLIVNVPKTFTVNSGNGFGHFTIPPIAPNPDTSTQVIATSLENIGNGAAGTSHARSISISITAPPLTGETDAKLYVMYVLAEGVTGSPTNDNWEIGPIDEVVIRVNPPP
jgi:hypothetical protein